MAKINKGSRKARSSAARLAAVQTVYRMVTEGGGAEQAAREFLDHYAGLSVDGQDLLPPEKTLYGFLVGGVEDRRADLETLLEKNLKKDGQEAEGASRNIDNLLKSILLCGAYELMANHEVDAPVIIADYLNVTHAFYQGREAALVNGVLDAIKGILR